MYHENYVYYKQARDKAWETLIKCKVTSLPVNLATIAKLNTIAILKYSESADQNLTGDGFSFKSNGRCIIYYNDLKPTHRIRFTIAHELGHCLLGHLLFGKTYHRNSEINTNNIDIREMQANVFARDTLMPATVLHSLRINSADDISKICNVSIQSAEIRYKRLLELEKRGMFNKHPLERQIHNNFEIYIKKLLDNCNI